ncbi:MAG: DUF262 domain-containing HNH endonuclease family protein [Dehalococcoidia bacterium]
MEAIQPKYLSLAQLFNGRLFRIPDYQRAYSWTSRQRSDLFGDISRTQQKGADYGHFMATVVCLRRETQLLGTDQFDVLEVVDGQQRLTTLIILVNVVKVRLSKANKAEAKLAAELGELLVKPEADELLLLQTNHDSSHHFANYLRTGKAPASASAQTIADRELLQAIEECGAFVEAWQSAGETLSNLVALLKNRLFFLLHEVNDEKIVYTVFEVLNSRGLEVAWLDRLKSILMGSAFDLENVNQSGIIDQLHSTWRGIYSVIGLRQGLSTEALRFAGTLRLAQIPSRPLSEEGSVATLRVATTAKDINAVSAWLLSVTTASDAVIANRRTDSVTRIAQARLLAVAIKLRDDLRPAEKRALLQRWEKVSFRIYGMLGNDARTGVGDYVRLAWRIVNRDLPFADIDGSIAKIGEDYPIQDAVEDGLREEDCYSDWQNELRYFMSRYEEFLAKKNNQKFSNEQWEKIWMASASRSIEHIWPQSKAPEKHKHRIGNLVLLPPGLNSKLQDKPAKEKAKEYRKTGLLIAGEVADAIEANGWNAKTIAQREEALLEWAKSEWAD